jgi:hypothetical protein
LLGVVTRRFDRRRASACGHVGNPAPGDGDPSPTTKAGLGGRNCQAVPDLVTIGHQD